MAKKKKNISKKSRSTSPIKRNKKSFIQQNYLVIGLIVLIGIVGIKFLAVGNSSNQNPADINISYQAEHKSPTEAMSPTRTLANPNPQRNNCPDGYYYFENDAYSVCYPEQLTAYIYENTMNKATGQKEKDTIQLLDETNKSTITILPSYRDEEGNSDCVERKDVTVSGYKAVREIRTEHLGKDRCGKLISIITTGKSIPFYILYSLFSGGELRFSEQYPIIEQSLMIK